MISVLDISDKVGIWMNRHNTANFSLQIRNLPYFIQPHTFKHSRGGGVRGFLSQKQQVPINKQTIMIYYKKMAVQRIAYILG